MAVTTLALALSPPSQRIRRLEPGTNLQRPARCRTGRPRGGPRGSPSAGPRCQQAQDPIPMGDDTAAAASWDQPDCCGDLCLRSCCPHCSALHLGLPFGVVPRYAMGCRGRGRPHRPTLPHHSFCLVFLQLLRSSSPLDTAGSVAPAPAASAMPATQRPPRAAYRRLPRVRRGHQGQAVAAHTVAAGSPGSAAAWGAAWGPTVP